MRSSPFSFGAGRFGMRSASSGLRHPASASCLGRHSRLAGRCPNNSSLFPPLAAVVVVALWPYSAEKLFLFVVFHGRGRKGKRQLPFPAASLLCEKGISERPQTLRNSETINNPSLNYAQSNAERILNRSPAGEPAFHCFLHSAQTFLQSLCNDVPTGAQCVL